MNILLDRLGQRIEKGDFIALSAGTLQAYEVVDTGELVQNGPGGAAIRTISLISRIRMNIAADAPQIDAYKIVYRPSPEPSKLS